MGSCSLNKRENERELLSGRSISLVIFHSDCCLAVKEKPAQNQGLAVPRGLHWEGMVGDVLFHRAAEQTVPSLLLFLPTMGSVGNLVLLLISIQRGSLRPRGVYCVIWGQPS